MTLTPETEALRSRLGSRHATTLTSIAKWSIGSKLMAISAAFMLLTGVVLTLLTMNSSLELEAYRPIIFTVLGILFIVLGPLVVCRLLLNAYGSDRRHGMSACRSAARRRRNATNRNSLPSRAEVAVRYLFGSRGGDWSNLHTNGNESGQNYWFPDDKLPSYTSALDLHDTTHWSSKFFPDPPPEYDAPSIPTPQYRPHNQPHILLIPHAALRPSRVGPTIQDSIGARFAARVARRAYSLPSPTDDSGANVVLLLSPREEDELRAEGVALSPIRERDRDQHGTVDVGVGQEYASCGVQAVTMVMEECEENYDERGSTSSSSGGGPSMSNDVIIDRQVSAEVHVAQAGPSTPPPCGNDEGGVATQVMDDAAHKKGQLQVYDPKVHKVMVSTVDTAISETAAEPVKNGMSNGSGDGT